MENIDKNTMVAILFEIMPLYGNHCLLFPRDYILGSINDDRLFVDQLDIDTPFYSFDDERIYDFLNDIEENIVTCYGYELNLYELMEKFGESTTKNGGFDSRVRSVCSSYYESICSKVYFIRENSILNDGVRTYDKIVLPVDKIDDLVNLSDESNKNESTDNEVMSGILVSPDEMEKIIKKDKNALELCKKALDMYKKGQGKVTPNVGLNNSESNIRLKINLDDFEKYLKGRVVGQDEAIEKIATAIAMNYRTKDKKNIKKILALGPTGVGKTETFEAIADYLDVPVTIYPTSSVTQNGYKGDDITDVLVSAYLNGDTDLKRAQNGIIVFDEFDKIAKRGNDINDAAVQHLLLKFLDGNNYHIALEEKIGSSSYINFDTSLLNIACLGAFTDLFEELLLDKKIGFQTTNGNIVSPSSKDYSEDIIKYGIIRELIGRFECKVVYNMLDLETINKILSTPSCSPIERFRKRIYDDFGTQIVLEDSFKRKVASRAYEMKMGARSLRNIIDQSVYQVERLLLNNDDIKEITLTADTIDDPHKYKVKK